MADPSPSAAAVVGPFGKPIRALEKGGVLRLYLVFTPSSNQAGPWSWVVSALTTRVLSPDAPEWVLGIVQHAAKREDTANKPPINAVNYIYEMDDDDPEKDRLATLCDAGEYILRLDITSEYVIRFSEVRPSIARLDEAGMMLEFEVTQVTLESLNTANIGGASFYRSENNVVCLAGQALPVGPCLRRIIVSKRVWNKETVQKLLQVTPSSVSWVCADDENEVMSGTLQSPSPPVATDAADGEKKQLQDQSLDKKRPGAVEEDDQQSSPPLKRAKIEGSEGAAAAATSQQEQAAGAPEEKQQQELAAQVVDADVVHEQEDVVSNEQGDKVLPAADEKTVDAAADKVLEDIVAGASGSII